MRKQFFIIGVLLVVLLWAGAMFGENRTCKTKTSTSKCKKTCQTKKNETPAAGYFIFDSYPAVL